MDPDSIRSVPRHWSIEYMLDRMSPALPVHRAPVRSGLHHGNCVRTGVLHLATCPLRHQHLRGRDPLRDHLPDIRYGSIFRQCFGSGSGFNQVSGSVSGSRRAKMTHKNFFKEISCFEVLNPGLPLWGPRVRKLLFLIETISQILGIPRWCGVGYFSSVVQL